MSSRTEYSLGSDEQELARLDRQAALLAPLSDMLLRAAGIGPSMRVLDLGTGLGHVATMVADLVGPDGSVVGGAVLLPPTIVGAWGRRPG